MGALNMTEQFAGGANSPVLRVGPRLDAAAAPGVREELDRLIATGTDILTADLSETTFIDSAGLAVLVKAMITLRRRGGDLEIVRPQASEAWRVFKLTKFDTVFTLHADVDPDSGGL
jgi:anti-sigma B factor antagonist